MFEVGDRVEFNYIGLVGEGVIRKVKKSFLFGNRYLITAIVTRHYSYGVRNTAEECFLIKEKDVLGKIIQ